MPIINKVINSSSSKFLPLIHFWILMVWDKKSWKEKNGHGFFTSFRIQYVSLDKIQEKNFIMAQEPHLLLFEQKIKQNRYWIVLEW